MHVIILEKDMLYQRAAERFYEAARDAVWGSGRFSVALSGGVTPRPLYKLLAHKFAHQVPWKDTHVFFSDERCVPPDHSESNYGAAHKILLSKVDIPEQNVHRIKGEIEPKAAADEYSELIHDFFGLELDEFPVFDLILLGMAADGHIASIFPRSKVVHETTSLAVAVHVRSLITDRVTLSPPILQHAERLLLLVTGSEKAVIVKNALEAAYEPDRWPAHLLRHAQGDVTWLVDPEAGKLLSED